MFVGFPFWANFFYLVFLEEVPTELYEDTTDLSIISTGPVEETATVTEDLDVPVESSAYSIISEGPISDNNTQTLTNTHTSKLKNTDPPISGNWQVPSSAVNFR